MDRSSAPQRLLRMALLSLAAIGVGLAVSLPVAAIVVLTTLIAVIDAGVQPLSDRWAVVTGGGYGSIRMFGSLGWICVAPLGGAIADQLGIGVLFWGFAGLLVGAAVLAGFNRIESSGEENSEGSEDGVEAGASQGASPGPGAIGSIRNGLRSLVEVQAVRYLVPAVILHDFVARSLFRFEPLYLDRLGVNLGMVGFASAIPAMVELAGMPIADALGKRWSPGTVMMAGILAFLLRMVLVVAAPVQEVIIATKILDGIEFSFVLVGTVGMISALWPAGRIGTVLAVLTVSLPQLVQLAAFPTIGALFELFGGPPLYVLGFLTSGAALLLLIALQRASGRAAK